MNIISTILSYVTRGVKDVENWVKSLFVAVYRIIDNGIDTLYRDIDSVYDRVVGYVHDIEHDIDSVIDWARNAIDTGIDDLRKFLVSAINDVSSFATSVYHWAESEFDSFIKWVDATFDDLETWVIKNVWDPIWDSLDDAIHWIEHAGSYMYNLLTHPDQLAQFLIHWIWLEWINLLKQYGRIVALWLLHEMKNLVHELVPILEDIFTNIL